MFVRRVFFYIILSFFIYLVIPLNIYSQHEDMEFEIRLSG